MTTPSVATLVHESLGERVYKSLRDHILSQAYPPGSKLNVEQLCRNLGVSRTPVWDAMRRLETEGLVSTVARHGVFVLNYGVDKVRDLFAVRGALEALAAGEAARRLDADERLALEVTVRRLEDAARDIDVEAYSRAAIDFHDLVLAAARNQVLRKLLETVYAQILVLRLRSLYLPERLASSVAEHRAIFAAVAAGDADRAEHLSRAHADHVLADALEFTGRVPRPRRRRARRAAQCARPPVRAPLTARRRAMAITAREYDFLAARKRLEAKPKPAADKRTSLEEAAARVKDGDHIAIGGCLYSRTPLGLVREILRRRPRGLTLSRNLMCYEAEWGLVAGAVDKIVTSWMGIGLPWGLSRILREYVESGRVVFEEWSHLGLGLRFRAAAMGLPFLPTLTMLGSDLMDVGGSKTITCPYTGETLHAVPALYPDVSLIHVHRADRFGNCQIDGYPHMDADLALAASTVLVTAEEIVSEDEIRRHPDRTVIPSFAVDALVHVPYGSYPHECYGLYDSEPAHFGRYVDGIKEHGAGGVARYLDRYVYGPASHADYLDLFGAGALESARERAQELSR